jgi:hypothetical protein
MTDEDTDKMGLGCGQGQYGITKLQGKWQDNRYGVEVGKGVKLSNNRRQKDSFTQC